MANVQHASLTADADVHEPKGAAAAAADTVYLANGAGSGSFSVYPDAGSVGSAKGIVNSAADIGALTDSTGETPNDTIVDVEVTDSTTETPDTTIADGSLTDSSGGSAGSSVANPELTDNTGGTPASELVAISGSGDDTDINANFASIAASIATLNDSVASIVAALLIHNQNDSDLAAALAKCNENFSDLADHINDIRTNLRAAGSMD